MAPTSRTTAASLGKMPTTRDRRLISLVTRNWAESVRLHQALIALILDQTRILGPDDP
jgi:hypothetical protein